MIKVGIVGGTGYTGVELLRLLATHPQVELTAITSRKEDGMPVADMFPSLRGFVSLAFSAPEKARLTDCDVVFFATPHGVAMAQKSKLYFAAVDGSALVALMLPVLLVSVDNTVLSFALPEIARNQG